jgi:organic radical activating enzyme
MSENLKWSEYDFTKIPFDDLVRVGQRTMLYRDMFTVSWLLGRFCNYRCSYCWPYARSDKKDHRPTELCLLTIDEIKKQARERGFNSFHFSLSGGEPTFHPGYLDILKHLADDVSNTNYTSVHMTSNCSRNMKWFEQYVKTVAPFHRAGMPQRAFTESKNVHVTRPKATFKKQPDPIYQPDKKIPQHFQVEFKDKENKEWYMDQAERFNAFNFNKFSGWECSSGYRSIIIREPDGSIKRSYSCHDKPLGNIETGFRLFDKPVRCISPTCVSSADSKIPKRAPGTQLPLWPGDKTYE